MRETKCNAPAWAALVVAGLFASPAHGAAIIYNLGTLGGLESYATAINASGQVTGASAGTGNVATHAFLYTGTPGSGGVMRDLGTLGGTESGATAINGSGQVAGYTYRTGNGAYHAFLYTGTPGSGGYMTDLGTLGGSDSYANAINDSGWVAGYGNLTTCGSVYHAFLYSRLPGNFLAMRDLGTLGGTTSFALALNDSGQVAGYSLTASNVAHAFLYTGTHGVDGVMTDLDAWLDANNPTEGVKWTLSRALGIGDTGWITGSAEYDDGPGGLTDGTRGFLLDASALVPEPASLSLLTLGGLTLLLRRRP